METDPSERGQQFMLMHDCPALAQPESVGLLPHPMWVGALASAVPRTSARPNLLIMKTPLTDMRGGYTSSGSRDRTARGSRPSVSRQVGAARGG